MSSLARIENFIDSALVDLGKLTAPSTRKQEFRCSSLPFCPIRSAFLDSSEESFRKSFYVEIGTVVHKVVQIWLARGMAANDMYGIWKRVSDGCETKIPMLRPKAVKLLGTEDIVYEEVTIKWRNLSGHVDLITHIGNNEYVVWDFKTTDIASKRRFAGWQKTFKTSPNYFIQIRSYAALLRKLFGINIVAWGLIIVDRDKPIESTKDYHKIIKPWKIHNHKKQMRLLNSANDNYLLFDEFRQIMARSKEYNPEAVKLLKEMIINRPCIDDESYNEWMDYAFYKGECEFKEACLKSNKAVLRRIEEIL